MIYFDAIYLKNPPGQGSKKKTTRIGPMGLDMNSSNPKAVDGRNPANHLTCMKPW